MQEEELRKYVGKKLRHSLFPPVWSLLLREQYVDDVLMGAETADWLVDRAREMLASRSSVETSGEPANEQGPNLGQERTWALSQLVAHHASTDRDVMAFRSRHLPNGFVSPDDVEKWLNERA